MPSSPPVPPSPEPPPPPIVKAPAASTGSGTTTLVPILIGVGVLMFTCILLPLLIGIPMLLFLSWDSDAQPLNETVVGPNFQNDFKSDVPPDFSLPQIPEPPQGSDEKQALYQQMLAAEQAWLQANAEYEALYRVYEQQRNFNAQQAGRLGAQGISVTPAQPPDQFRVLAAQSRYEAAKAAYEAAQ